MGKLYFFIINPKSGFNLDIAGVRHMRNYLRQKGHKLQLELTRSLEHAGQLARQAVAAGAVTVVVVGGDGTVRTVVDAIAGSEVPILIIPCGTENLLATELGLDGSVKQTLETLEHGILRKLDLARANDRYFMAIVGVGFDAEVVRRVHQVRSGHITHFNYIWPICRTFWEYHFAPMRVEVDGELVCDEPALVFVSNIPRYAVGLGISLDADLSDGLLDLCIYKCNSRLRLLSHSLLTVMRTSHMSKLTLRRQCREINISSSDPNVLVQIDGDPGPSLPLNIKVIPAAAQILTPPPPKANLKYHPPVRMYHLRRWLLG